MTQFGNVGEEILNQHHNGMLDKESANLANALFVADNLRLYKPKFYPDMPDSLQSYVRARLNGMRTEPDKDFEQKVGQWIYTCTWIREQNFSDLELLQWSLETIRPHGHTAQCSNIESYMKSFPDNFPYDVFNQAYQVRLMDKK